MAEREQTKMQWNTIVIKEPLKRRELTKTLVPPFQVYNYNIHPDLILEHACCKNTRKVIKQSKVKLQYFTNCSSTLFLK